MELRLNNIMVSSLSFLFVIFMYAYAAPTVSYYYLRNSSCSVYIRCTVSRLEIYPMAIRSCPWWNSCVSTRYAYRVVYRHTFRQEPTCCPGYQTIGPICAPICYQGCGNGGFCAGQNICSCKHGYYGSRCENVICDRRCENGGSCTKPNLCSCKMGYQGNRCETPICQLTCLNGGNCTDRNFCMCRPDFRGRRCEYRTTSYQSTSRSPQIQPQTRPTTEEESTIQSTTAASPSPPLEFTTVYRDSVEDTTYENVAESGPAYEVQSGGTTQEGGTTKKTRIYDTSEMELNSYAFHYSEDYSEAEQFTIGYRDSVEDTGNENVAESDPAYEVQSGDGITQKLWDSTTTHRSGGTQLVTPRLTSTESAGRYFYSSDVYHGSFLE